MAFNINFSDEMTWYEENFEVENANEIETKDLEECEYKSMRETYDLFMIMKKENEEVKEEMDTMYHIIMNDGDKCEISKNQPLIKIVQFNIGLMLEKFKQMSEKIKEVKEKIEYLSEYQDDHPAMRHKVVLEADYYQTHCSCDYGSLEEMSEKIEQLEDQIEQGVYIEEAYYTKFCGNDYEGGIEEMSEKIVELKEENKKIKRANELNSELWDTSQKCIGELEKEKDQMNKISNVKTDLINNLFSKIVGHADIDDGISISKDYGDKYIDEWNKIYEDLIKDTIKEMNEYELDCVLKFHDCGNIEFCMEDSDDDSDDEDE